MAELFKCDDSELGEDKFKSVGYTENDVRRLVDALNDEYGGQFYHADGSDLLDPFRHLTNGGKTNG